MDIKLVTKTNPKCHTKQENVENCIELIWSDYTYMPEIMPGFVKRYFVSPLLTIYCWIFDVFCTHGCVCCDVIGLRTSLFVIHTSGVPLITSKEGLKFWIFRKFHWKISWFTFNLQLKKNYKIIPFINWWWNFCQKNLIQPLQKWNKCNWDLFWGTTCK